MFTNNVKQNQNERRRLPTWVSFPSYDISFGEPFLSMYMNSTEHIPFQNNKNIKFKERFVTWKTNDATCLAYFLGLNTHFIVFTRMQMRLGILHLFLSWTTLAKNIHFEYYSSKVEGYLNYRDSVRTSKGELWTETLLSTLALIILHSIYVGKRRQANATPVVIPHECQR